MVSDLLRGLGDRSAEPDRPFRLTDSSITTSRQHGTTRWLKNTCRLDQHNGWLTRAIDLRRLCPASATDPAHLDHLLGTHAPLRSPVPTPNRPSRTQLQLYHLGYLEVSVGFSSFAAAGLLTLAPAADAAGVDAPPVGVAPPAGFALEGAVEAMRASRALRARALEGRRVKRGVSASNPGREGTARTRLTDVALPQHELHQVQEGARTPLKKRRLPRVGRGAA